MTKNVFCFRKMISILRITKISNTKSLKEKVSEWKIERKRPYLSLLQNVVAERRLSNPNQHYCCTRYPSPSQFPLWESILWLACSSKESTLNLERSRIRARTGARVFSQERFATDLPLPLRVVAPDDRVVAPDKESRGLNATCDLRKSNYFDFFC